MRSSAGPEYRPERLDTDDGDVLELDWAPEPRPGAPLALVLHGLEGNADRSYVRTMVRELLAQGVWPVILNFRGCRSSNRTPRFYHSGETGDPTLVLDTLRERFPHRPVGAVGFSLGGNILLKLLGERDDGGARLLDAAVAVSVPFDLAAGCDLLAAGGMGRFYTWYFMRSLRRKVRRKVHLLDDVLDLDAVEASRSLRRFDDVATAPLHGFRDAAHYYEASSSSGYLQGIRTPTLVLHALDDPFLPEDAVPVEEIESNPAIQSVLTPTGGHVGFLEGTPLNPRFWAESEAARYLALRLGAERSGETTRTEGPKRAVGKARPGGASQPEP